MKLKAWLVSLLFLFCTLPAWALDAPANLTVPASDPDGGFSVSWTAVPGTGVSYELQQATDAAFTADLQSVFTGTKTKVSLKGRTAGKTYHYRVKSMAGGDESVWVAAANGCDVPYRVSTKANAGGTINPPPGLVTIPVGTTQAVTITPNTGFHIVSVVVDGVVKVDAKAETVAPYSHTTAYTVNVPADLVDNPKNKHKIAAKFKANSYEVTATAGAGGKITPVGTKKKKHGKQATYTVTPDSGMKIASLLVNGVEQSGLPASGAYKLPLVITEETDIAASFTAAPGTATTQISGVAAAGAPLAGYVSLKDSRGNPTPALTTLLAKDGSFTFDVTGLVPPFYLKAQGVAGNTDYELHSVVTSTGTANVNPLTQAQAAVATGADPATLYANPAAVGTSNVAMQAALAQAAADLKTMLKPLLDAWQTPLLNPTTDVYVADGTGLDKVFDVADVNVAGNAIQVVDRASSSTVAAGTIKANGGGLASITPINPSLPVAAASDLDQIKLFLAEWLTAMKTITAKFANGGYSSQQEAINAAAAYYVGAQAFGINEGNTLEQELEGWLEDYVFASALKSISNVNIASYDSTTGVYLVNLVLNLQLYGPEAQLVCPSLALVKVGNDWKVTGNGFYAESSDIDMVSFETARNVFADQTTTATVIGFELDDNQGVFSSATVTGPGLPPGGLLFTSNQEHWELLSDQNLWECSAYNPDSSCRERIWNSYPLPDNAIAAMPQICIYTVTFRFQDGRPDEVHTVIKPGKPLLSSQITDGYFTTVNNFSAANLAISWASQNLAGKTVNVNYSTPSAYNPVHVEMSSWFGYETATGDWGDLDIEDNTLVYGSNKTKSFTFPALPAGTTLRYGDVEFFGEDTLWRSFTTHYNFR